MATKIAIMKSDLESGRLDEPYQDITKNVQSGNVAEAVRELIARYPVIMFSKSTCPFCFELKRTLSSLGVDFAVVEVNKTNHQAELKRVLTSISNVSTFPNLFIQGKSYGGCVDIKALEFSRTLLPLLTPYMTKTCTSEVDMKRVSLFYFPETINGHAAQASGVLGMITSILCVIFYDNPVTQWAVLGLAIDFLLRMVFGASYSLIGMIATIVTAHLPPKWSAGPPKQFAAFCGLFFSTFGAGLYLSHQRVGGAIVIAMLAGAAGLEGIFDFCLGCWMFGLAISFGVISPLVYRPYLNLLEEKKFGYIFTHTKRDLPIATSEHVLLPGQVKETPVDLIRKDRLELEYKIQDRHMIKHMTIDFFAFPMSIMTLAYMFQLTDKHAALINFNTGYAAQVLAIIAAILGGCFLCLYILRGVFFPHKMEKELQHPIFGNYFSTVPITIVLYGLVLIQQTVTGGISLIWIGAIMQMMLTILKLSNVIFHRLSEDWYSPAMMMTPVGNFIAALAFGLYSHKYPDGPNENDNINYIQLGRLWFSIAMLFTIVFFTISFQRTMQEHHSDSRQRFNLWVWLATAAAIGPAYLQVLTNPAAEGTGLFFQCMWSIALIIGVVLSIGYIKGFFIYNPDMSIWIVPFALTVFAINTITYYSYTADRLFLTLSFIAGAMACASNAVTALHVIHMLVDGSLWTPKQKWGPVNFMKLTHEAFRFHLPLLWQQIQVTSGSSTIACELLVKDMKKMMIAFHEHSQHEDQVLFPAVRRYFPRLNEAVDVEHEKMHVVMAEFQRLCDAFLTVEEEGKGGGNNSRGEALIAGLMAGYETWMNDALTHLRHEENTITVAVRKYVPIEYQRQLTRECFESVTSGEAWRVVLPYTIENLPIMAWKVRFVRTFVWAVPERAQEIGLMLYSALDRVQWLALVREIPEMIPRGLPGHQRIY